ncbi:hypothetical protein [uncultured Herbaspirillum sp.]|uniref:hypothetical protein n=1 Tax=uncultured Herbaspirillum sp. TaxID=160236 RepID=UPI0025900994|nr:hypothetical protein [uncultured Herbaspirillum sp.]
MEIKTEYFDKFAAREINGQARLTIIKDASPNEAIVLPVEFSLRTGGGNYEGFIVQAIGGGRIYTLRHIFKTVEEADTVMQEAMKSWAAVEESLRRV